MSQIEVGKLTGWAAIGPSGEVSVGKLVMYALLVPGESGPDTSNKQGHVYVQIVGN